MPTFEVDIWRTSYSSRIFEIEAENKEKAEEIALDIAGDYEFTEHTSDYEVGSITQKE